MKKLILISTFVLVPALVSAFTAGDFIVNNQPTYAVPPGTTQVLILDLTLPEPIDSIKFENNGTIQQYNISQLTIFDDGNSAGWDADEAELFRKTSSPFFDEALNFPKFSQKRIFVTLNMASTTVSGRTVKLKAVIGENSVVGLERTISADAPIPDVPITPFAGIPEALSTSTVRWHFEDRSNNEFGFKILDGNLKEVARNETAGISYIDETGLQPDTDYSGRRVIAFNDRGESLGSALAFFPAVRTLKEPAQSPTGIEAGGEVAPQPAAEIKEPAEPSLLETIQQKIAEIQQKLNELIKQLNELIAQQSASIWQAFQGLWITFF